MNRAVVVQHQQATVTIPSVSVIDERGRLPTRGGQRYPRRNIAAVDGGRVHYTAGPTSSTTRDIAAYQVGPGAQEAFPEIAYHYLVEGDGSVHWCHDLDVRVWGSGAPGSNERDVHVCYTGDREPNAKQLVGIRTALIHAQQQRGRSLTIGGHKDNYATSCPGPTWPDWRAAILP